MGSGPIILNLVVEFVYVSCHGQKNTFRGENDWPIFQRGLISKHGWAIFHLISKQGRFWSAPLEVADLTAEYN